MFKTTDNKARGFHMAFDNGRVISVQWGRGNYCENYNKPKAKDGDSSATAEIASWCSKCNKWLKLTSDDEVKGWLTADEVADYMASISTMVPCCED